MYLGGNRRWAPLNQGHIFVNNSMARNMSCMERNVGTIVYKSHEKDPLLHRKS